ncbi:hypothetical protein EXIGLDRAFT_761128 [Exidia glandulosa HHB12029]|uniref:Uncharacterized protein n=1 Tax=Exidia glandulosa HHB12029 TaxID=1314781 RepID=A0A165NRN4_EXIGL|nr:hypothetical protein EXIGLDRAFT_761128 [Exidia glandulosa HHB12029]
MPPFAPNSRTSPAVAQDTDYYATPTDDIVMTDVTPLQTEDKTVSDAGTASSPHRLHGTADVQTGEQSPKYRITDVITTRSQCSSTRESQKSFTRSFVRQIENEEAGMGVRVANQADESKGGLVSVETLLIDVVYTRVSIGRRVRKRQSAMCN